MPEPWTHQPPRPDRLRIKQKNPVFPGPRCTPITEGQDSPLEIIVRTLAAAPIDEPAAAIQDQAGRTFFKLRDPTGNRPSVPLGLSRRGAIGTPST